MDIFLINAITEIHIGGGQGVGLIDNSLIRHRRNNFCYLPASTLKGALKEKWRRQAKQKIQSPNAEDHPDDKIRIPKDDDLWLIFGPDSETGMDHASGLCILDAEILFLPVRSLAGIFGWVTCPMVLWEFAYRLQKLGQPSETIEKLLQDSATLAQLDEQPMNAYLSAAKSSLQYEKGLVLLEDYKLKSTHNQNFANFVAKISSLWNFDYLKEQFKKKSMLVSDDIFAYFVSCCTAVAPNIRIDPDTGITADASLRYTEYLPEYSVFHSAFLYQDIKQNSTATQNHAEAIRKKFLEPGNISCFPLQIQIGGDETLGKGQVVLTLFREEKAS